MDICAGGAETTDILEAAFHEAIETGFYTLDGERIVPGRLVLHDNPMMQHITDAAAIEEWTRILGHKPSFGHDITVQVTSYTSGADRFINPSDPRGPLSCILSTIPSVNSLEVVVGVRLDLPEVEGGWRVRDTEHMEVKGEQMALNRRPVLIVPIEGQAPVILGLGHDGLDPSATIAYLDGSNLKMLINGNVSAVLRFLGWIEK